MYDLDRCFVLFYLPYFKQTVKHEAAVFYLGNILGGGFVVMRLCVGWSNV